MNIKKRLKYATIQLPATMLIFLMSDPDLPWFANGILVLAVIALAISNYNEGAAS